MRLVLGALAALTVLRLILAATVPLTPDETYYFLWSRHLQAGYYDAPSMVAVWMRIGTSLLGDNPLGIRLLGPISAGFGTLLLMDAGERMFPHRQAGLMAAAMLNATLMVGAGSIIMTPDTPLIFFWTAGIAAFARLLEHENPRWWLAVGVAAGLALYSKYTAALFVAAAFIWMITDAKGRARLRTPWPWAAILIALAIFAPNLWWNGTHGWVSYLKQGSRVAHFDAARSLQFLGEFLGGQLALLTPIIFGLAIWGTWRLGRAPSAAAHLLVWMTVVPGVVFLEHVISGRVQPNWVAIIYPSACLAAASLPMADLRRWLKPALGLGFALTAIAYAQALAAPFPLRAGADPTALQMRGFAGLVAQAAARHPAFLTSDDYATAAILAYYAPHDIPVAGFDPRWRYFDFPAAHLANQTGILVTRRSGTPCEAEIGTVTRRRDGQPIQTYRLCRFTAPATGVLLPRP
ncbi:glycosyltransferase family 39 protein [Acidocella sp.]|jgi:4-amino-4-deoxy-L-arabinose transferase-like glycosyltransferase|uniref:glycosyltransferase family 39 protein n=1 Tax=Acidocella sp. TaxID=50710 RepID=UPI002F3F3B30